MHKGRLLRAVIRLHLVNKLHDGGTPRAAARSLVRERLDDETIDEFTAVAGIADAPDVSSAFGDWFKEHWPQILEVVLKLLPLLLMFLAEKPVVE